VLELPKYRKPDWTNVWVEVRSKAGAFIREAGKVIIVISVVLWFLASFGMPGSMKHAEQVARTEASVENLSIEQTDDLIASHKLEASFAGNLGKLIEPVIRPLGYDWKIGIALITSFAAREVFVGSMATIYSVGSDADEFKLREFLANVKDPETGNKVFNFATALSLIFFYLLALQCMSTLAVVRKETGTWKWPVVQFVFMGVLAYVVSFLVYQWAS
jgi:ferrous iron transport protein B